MSVEEIINKSTCSFEYEKNIRDFWKQRNDMMIIPMSTVDNGKATLEAKNRVEDH